VEPLTRQASKGAEINAADAPTVAMIRFKCITIALLALVPGVLLDPLLLQKLALGIVNLAPLFSRAVIVRDITFGSEPSQKLDIFMPAAAKTGSLPVIVFFYGGRWTLGSKGSYRFVGDAFAKRGYIVAIPDYRKYPQVRFPSFVEDGAKALAWVHDHIADYGGAPDRIFVAGHSAGAHIGALLASDPSYLAQLGKDRNAVIRGFAGLAGPYSFTPDAPDLKDIFGPPERYAMMQATTFIDGSQPPMLLLYGDADTVVKRINLDRLGARIRERGGSVKSIVYPGVNHIWILGALSWLNFRGPPVLADTLTFFDAAERLAQAPEKARRSIE
jgi:acetyl esterase/lipase